MLSYLYHFVKKNFFLHNKTLLWYHINMVIDNNKNKRYFVTISKDDYERLAKQAKKYFRSVNKQSLLYILEGLTRDEKEDSTR